MSSLEHLLVVQDHDTAADRLKHRRETLPEREAVAAASQRIVEIDAAIAQSEAERHELEREQRRAEDEISLLTDRIKSSDARLYSGEVTGTRELQALQDEVGGLQRRRSSLEDDVLELMVAAEPIDDRLGQLQSDRAETERSRDDFGEELAEREGEIDSELLAVEAARAAEAAELSDGLLAEYEQIRERRGGVGVAKLSGTTCTGCYLTLSAVDVDRIKHEPADAVVHCPECGSILVR